MALCILARISLGSKVQPLQTVLIFWTKFALKRIPWDKNWKSRHHHSILHTWISQSTAFHLKLTILIFCTKFMQKGYFSSKTEKWTPPLNSAYSNKLRYKISGWTDNFEFLDQICPKRIFLVGNRESEHHRWILHIQICQGTKFQFKLVVCNFWTKFAQERYFGLKTEKINGTIEFCIFELVSVPNFSPNW